MDYTLWSNIYDQGESPAIIDQNTEIENFSWTLNGQSLLHYFCKNSEIMEVIHNKYFALKASGTMNDY